MTNDLAEAGLTVKRGAPAKPLFSIDTITGNERCCVGTGIRPGPRGEIADLSGCLGMTGTVASRTPNSQQLPAIGETQLHDKGSVSCPVRPLAAFCPIVFKTAHLGKNGKEYQNLSGLVARRTSRCFPRCRLLSYHRGA